MSAAIAVVPVGAASGVRAAAAALACAGSEPDRAGLLIDLGATRAPRPSLFATAGARRLEERLAAHLPQAGVAARGATCHLTPGEGDGLELLAAVLPLVRDSVGVVHLPPGLLQPVLDRPGVGISGAMLRADLPADRALTALAARDLVGRGLRVSVLRRPLSWPAGRAALHGALPAGHLPAHVRERLLP